MSKIHEEREWFTRDFEELTEMFKYMIQNEINKKREYDYIVEKSLKTGEKIYILYWR